MDQNWNMVSVAKAITINEISSNKKQRHWINDSLNMLMQIIIGILFILILFMNLFILCPVQQESMLPTIRDGQRVLLLKTSRVKSGDIFVYRTNEIDDGSGQYKNLIKRAVAVGGEKILFVVFGRSSSQIYDDRTVYMYKDSGNGFVLVSEDYLNEPMKYLYMQESEFCKVLDAGPTAQPTKVLGLSESSFNDYVIQVPKNSYYALGDNRNRSHDSRKLGFVKKSQVVGVMKFKLQEGTTIEKILRRLYRDNKSVDQGEYYDKNYNRIHSRFRAFI